MGDLRFEWDERKNAANRRKHGVSFEDAQTAFSDDEALLLPDQAHSTQEDRLVLLGMSDRLRLLIVCHTCRQRGNVIRIISARKANGTETRQYFDRWRT